ncbi:major histocompatibility complex class I-related gene protein [Lates calcarifer]|uniref:Major histocompatibility complex class I-related gene protein n=1 Tax=Lates calcarifer TaxID=8187 RepID=A0AAJ8DMX0_LATCA|nr:major histocompatibility complex class I-related gene protein [Lates calcarifer]
MKKLMILLLSCQVASAVRYSLTFYLILSSGDPNIPRYMAMGDLERVRMIYYDTNIDRAEPRHDWVRKLIQGDPELWDEIVMNAVNYYQFFKTETDSFKRSNQTGGVHIIQQILDCEWDDETFEVDGYNQYGYDGEDFLAFDLKTETWIAANPQAKIIKQEWDKNQRLLFWKYFLTNTCLRWMKGFWIYAWGSLYRTDRPSVSLLQKTPSSPVSCHATGFYPDRAMMFWTKDGEELDEDVDRGEILPNHDGTFQMRADLKVSSIPSKDWRRYDCVFQLSGVKEDIITKLDKAEIRTNWRNGNDDGDQMKTTVIVVAVVVLVVVLISVVGFIVYKKAKGERLTGVEFTLSSRLLHRSNE